MTHTDELQTQTLAWSEFKKLAAQLTAEKLSNLLSGSGGAVGRPSVVFASKKARDQLRREASAHYTLPKESVWKNFVTKTEFLWKRLDCFCCCCYVCRMGDVQVAMSGVEKLLLTVGEDTLTLADVRKALTRRGVTGTSTSEKVA